MAFSAFDAEFDADRVGLSLGIQANSTYLKEEIIAL